MKVRTDISGSILVVVKRELPCDLYIDVRRDARHPDYSFIEVVRSGQVKLRDCVHHSGAPERIVELMRSPIFH